MTLTNRSAPLTEEDDGGVCEDASYDDQVVEVRGRHLDVPVPRGFELALSKNS